MFRCQFHGGLKYNDPKEGNPAIASKDLLLALALCLLTRIEQLNRPGSEYHKPSTELFDTGMEVYAICD